MAILRSERTYPLAVKSATQYAINAGLTAAYDFQGDPNNSYLGGDGAPHVGAKSLTKPSPGATLVLVTTGIYGRDPSCGRTSTKTYTGASAVDYGVGSLDGSGNFTIHKRMRAPSSVLQTWPPRDIFYMTDGAGAKIVLYMYGTSSASFTFRWEVAGTMVPSGNQAEVHIPAGAMFDLHLTRVGDVFSAYSNGQFAESLTKAGVKVLNTVWNGLASNTNNGLAGSPPDDLILIDDNYWNRGLSAGEVFQHQSDPYAGYANTAVVPDGLTLTNPFTGATINSEGATIAGYYKGATVPTGIEFQFNGGAWTALTGVTISGGAYSGTTPALPNATGTLSVRMANATTLTATASNITAKTPNPTVVLTSQPPPDGQSQSFTFATTRATSVSVTLTANGNGAVTQGPATFTVTSNAASGTMAAIPPGDYTVAITTTGPGGTASIVGNPISILGVSGGGIPSTDGAVIIAPPPATPTITGVTISPLVATLAGLATRQFTAAAQGTNSPSQAFNWSCGAGNVSGTGLYTAPAASLVVQAIPVTATSAVDPQWSATAVVTIAALPPPPIDTNNVVLLTGDAVTVQQNTSSGGSVLLNSHFTSEKAPRERTIYL